MKDTMLHIVHQYKKDEETYIFDSNFEQAYKVNDYCAIFYDEIIKKCKSSKHPLSKNVKALWDQYNTNETINKILEIKTLFFKEFIPFTDNNYNQYNNQYNKKVGNSTIGFVHYIIDASLYPKALQKFVAHDPMNA
jgi:hypothetical protein